MRKALINIGIILLFTSVNVIAQGRIDLVYFNTLFQQHEYVRAFEEASAIRKQPYQKQFLLDYIMAKALCGNQQYDLSQRGFAFIENNYSLSENQREFIQKERANCEHADATTLSTADATTLAEFTMIMNLPHNVAFVRGKGGHLHVKEDEDLEPFQVDPAFNQSELAKRLFSAPDMDKASAFYQRLLGDAFTFYPEGQLLIITPSTDGLSSSAAEEIAGNLNHELNFFNDRFTFRKPTEIITVFLVNDKPQLDQLAARLHGLTLPKNNLGYSSFSDMTLVAIASDEYSGTLFHEMFHLAVRSDAGDLPEWLDEGVASLYETSYWKDGELLGDVKNWRTDILKDFTKANNKVPDLPMLIYPGAQLSADGSGTAGQSAWFYAVAKHFAIFLQEKQWLANVILAFKNRQDVFTNPKVADETPEQLLSKATGMSLTDLDAEFRFWVAVTYNIADAMIKSDFPIILAHQLTAINALKNTNASEYTDLKQANDQLQMVIFTNSFNDVYKALKKQSAAIGKAQKKAMKIEKKIVNT